MTMRRHQIMTQQKKTISKKLIHVSCLNMPGSWQCQHSEEILSTLYFVLLEVWDQPFSLYQQRMPNSSCHDTRLVSNWRCRASRSCQREATGQKCRILVFWGGCLALKQAANHWHLEWLTHKRVTFGGRGGAPSIGLNEACHFLKPPQLWFLTSSDHVDPQVSLIAYTKWAIKHLAPNTPRFIYILPCALKFSREYTKVHHDLHVDVLLHECDGKSNEISFVHLFLLS